MEPVVAVVGVEGVAFVEAAAGEGGVEEAAGGTRLLASRPASAARGTSTR